MKLRGVLRVLQLYALAPALMFAWAQTPPSASPAYTPTATFEVASVRQSQIDRAGGFRVSGGFQPPTGCHLHLENFSLENMTRMAWALNISPKGLPVDSVWTVYKVEAKCSDTDEARLASLPPDQRALEQGHLIQALLADRFALKTHWESPDGPAFNLVVSKPGRLVAAGAPPSADELKNFGDHPIPSLYQRGSSRTGFDFIAHGASMETIVQMLTAQFGRPVIDKTGLTGKYDFTLNYLGTRTEGRKADDTNPIQPLDTAIQDQLGLKLVPTHAPSPVLIVDHVEKLSQN